MLRELLLPNPRLLFGLKPLLPLKLLLGELYRPLLLLGVQELPRELVRVPLPNPRPPPEVLNRVLLATEEPFIGNPAPRLPPRAVQPPLAPGFAFAGSGRGFHAQ